MVKIYFDYKNIPPLQSVVTLGNFDGFHLGHQRILQETVTAANSLGLPALAMTFHPHPRRFFGHRLPNINGLGQKLALLKRAGADVVLIQPFTELFASISPETFVDEVLIEALGCREVVVGYDYSFGKGGVGNTALLQCMASQRGIGCRVVPPVKYDGNAISSSSLREYLAAGNVEMAARCMGRPFVLRGQVVRGAGRGKLLGFPTANIHPSDSMALPAYGVFLVGVTCQKRHYWGVANLGNCPTFRGNSPTLEVFLLNFRGNLYGKILNVKFFRRLRPEIKFSDANSLRHQQRCDIQRAKTLLERDNMLKLEMI